MNRIVEDRLLLDECEKAFMSLNDTAKKNGVKSSVLDAILDKIKRHREKFTKRVLDKELYIKENKDVFDAIYERDSRIASVSNPDRIKDSKVKKLEKDICEHLVKNGFYSAKTCRSDIIRSLMRTYKKMFDK